MRIGRSATRAICLAVATLPMFMATPSMAYVSIWYDEVSGIWGWNEKSAATKGDADFEAGLDCYERSRGMGVGSGNCIGVVYSKSGCVALAINGDYWGSGSGASPERAQGKALARAGGGAVVMTNCDFWFR